MKKIITSILLLVSLTMLSSCSDDNDAIYVSTSGEGSVIIDYDVPFYLYRMVLFSSSSEQMLYLLGNSAYVDAEGDFKGRGTVMKFTMPNTEDLDTLEEMNFDIGSDDYFASYSPYVNYSSAEGEDDFVAIDSGTVVIRKSGSYYDVRLLGSDEDGSSVIVAYRGYIYRKFYDESDEEERVE